MCWWRHRRLMDLYNQGHVSLTGLEIFVLDEADRMLTWVSSGMCENHRLAAEKAADPAVFCHHAPGNCRAFPDPSPGAGAGGGDASVIHGGCHPAEAVPGGAGG